MLVSLTYNAIIFWRGSFVEQQRIPTLPLLLAHLLSVVTLQPGVITFGVCSPVSERFSLSISVGNTSDLWVKGTSYDLRRWPAKRPIHIIEGLEDVGFT